MIPATATAHANWWPLMTWLWHRIGWWTIPVMIAVIGLAAVLDAVSSGKWLGCQAAARERSEVNRELA